MASPSPSSCPPASSRQHAQVLSRLECPVCLEQYDLQARLPRLLHGGHTLCLQCTQQLLLKGAEDGGVVKCPLCSHDAPQPAEGYPINFTLVDVLEVMLLGHGESDGPLCQECDTTDAHTAVQRCTTCNQWMCQLHSDAHRRGRSTKLHTLKAIADIRADPSLYREVPLCAVHPTCPLDLFCVDCDQPICMRCPNVQHQKHEREEVSTAFERLCREMEPKIQVAERAAAAFAASVERAHTMAAQVTATHDTEAKRMREHFARLHQLLQAREELLLADLSATQTSRSKALQQQEQELRFDHAFALSTCEETRRLLAQTDDVRVLQQKAALFQQVATVAQEPHVASVQLACDADFRFAALGGEQLAKLLEEHGMLQLRPVAEEEADAAAMAAAVHTAKEEAAAAARDKDAAAARVVELESELAKAKLDLESRLRDEQDAHVALRNSADRKEALLREQFDQLKAGLLECDTQLKQRDMAIQERETYITAVSARCNEAEAKMRELEEQAKSDAKDIEAAQEQYAAVVQQYNSRVASEKELTERVQELETKLERSEVEVARLADELAHTEHQLEAAQGATASVKSQLAQAQAERTNAAAADKERAQAALQKHLTKMGALKKRLLADKESHRTALDGLKQEHAAAVVELQERANAAEQRAEEMAELRSAAEQQLSELRAAHDELASSHSQQLEAVQALMAKHSEELATRDEQAVAATELERTLRQQLADAADFRFEAGNHLAELIEKHGEARCGPREAMPAASSSSSASSFASSSSAAASAASSSLQANAVSKDAALKDGQEANAQVGQKHHPAREFGGSAEELATLTREQQLQLVKLNVSRRCSAMRDVQVVCSIIANSLNLRAVYLCANNIGAEGARAVADAIGRSSSITTVNLSSNNIGDEGARAVADAIGRSSSLTTVDLGANNIGAEGARAVADAIGRSSSITTVDLSCNKIGAEGARAVADAIGRSSSITTVNLIYNNIGDEGARAVAEAIGRSSSITTVDLSSNNIGDEGARAVADAIGRSSSLTTVYLCANNIGAEGARAVADAIGRSSSITTVDLSCNNIGAEGARAVADAIGRSSSMATVDLSENNIGDEVSAAMRAASELRGTKLVL